MNIPSIRIVTFRGFMRIINYIFILKKEQFNTIYLKILKRYKLE